MGIFDFLANSIRRGRKRRRRLGLALGSGGAKGCAHLGVLKAFEEAGIAFDVVSGTSIGSIVGALYCRGFSADDMFAIVQAINVREFAGKIRPFADMRFIEEYLSEFLEGDVTDLPKPFAAWATEVSTGEGVLLDSGPVARVCTASSAIPPFFRPVELNGRRLADGAFSNAIPADVCRDLGADLVIGCDLSAFLRPEAEKNAVMRLVGGMLQRVVPIGYRDDHKSRGYAASDLMLRPNLIDWRAVDVSRAAMQRMYEIGYEEAIGCMPAIREKLREAGI